MDVINQGMLFAATLLLCLFPFLIVASALADRQVVTTLARDTGLNGTAAADVGHLFAALGVVVAERAPQPGRCDHQLQPIPALEPSVFGGRQVTADGVRDGRIDVERRCAGPGLPYADSAYGSGQTS